MTSTAINNSGVQPLVDRTAQHALESQGVYLSLPGERSGPVFLFPGHGAQYPDMLAELAARYAVVHDTFARVDARYRELTGHTLTSRMFSAGSGDPARFLEDPEVTQPAIFAASIAVFRLLGEMGVEPEVLAGHSLGELTALAASGVLSIDDAVTAVHGRGRAVKTIEPGRWGSLLSVDLRSVENRYLVNRLMLLARSQGGHVGIGVVNTATRTVLSGDADSIERIATACQAHDIKAVRLPVSHAFHSDLLAPAVPIYEQTLRSLSWHAPRRRVLSGILGDYYRETDVEHLPAFLAQQLITPFDFGKLVERVYDEGLRIFVEVGPKATLSGLVRETLAGREAFIVPTNVPSLGAVESVDRFATFAEVHSLCGDRPGERWRRYPDSSARSSGATVESGHPGLLPIVARVTGYPLALLDPGKRMATELGMSRRVRDDIVRAVSDHLGTPVPGATVPDDATLDALLRHLAGSGAGRVTAAEPASAGSRAPAEVRRAVEPPPVEPPPAPTAAPLDVAAIDRLVLDVARAKTGYPAEVLELDLDLEGELGIDSLRQAEILATLREHLELPPPEDIDISELNTFRKVAALAAATAQRGTPPRAEEPARSAQPPPVPEDVDRVAQRYVPVAVRRPLDTRAAVHLDLTGKSVVLIADRDGTVARALRQRLDEAGAQVWLLSPASAALDAGTADAACVQADFDDTDHVAAALAELRERAKVVHAVVNLYAIRPDHAVGSTFSDPPRLWTQEVDTQFTVNLLAAKTFYDQLGAAGGDGGYLAGTTVGAAFGLERSANIDPLGGLTTGFVKSLALELPKARAKVVDVPDQPPEAVARVLFEELVHGGEPNVEIAYTGEERKVVQILPRPLDVNPRHAPFELSRDDVVVVTGGARGITYECARALAGAGDITVVLLGRTVLPTGTEDWVHLDDEQFAAYRLEYLRRARCDNPVLTPADAEAGFMRLAHGRLAYRNRAELRAINPRVHYETCDVSDGAQVREVISRVRRQFGPIAGVVHGAGLQSPALVSRKRLDRALGVVRTKVNGAYHLWHAVKDDDPKFFVLFGSTLGRSGMDGQTDYTAAADVLPKIAAQLSGERPHTRSFTLAWTAWAGTGMAADESVRRVQEEQRGLRYIGIREGVQTFARELLHGGRDSEVLVVGDIGTNTWRGQDAALDQTRTRVVAPIGPGGYVADVVNYPLLQRVRHLDGASAVAELRLDPDVHRYLADHRVRGIATFPGAFHIEGHAEVAGLLHPGRTLVSATDVEFVKFVKCHAAFPLTLSMRAGPAGPAAAGPAAAQPVAAETRSDLVRPGGPVLEADRLHSRGTYWFAEEFPAAPGSPRPVRQLLAGGRPLDLEAFYADTDRHIAFGQTFRCTTQVRLADDGSLVSELVVPDNRGLLPFLCSPRLRTMPVVMDNAWRSALIWAHHELGRSYVPISIRSIRFHRIPFPAETLYTISTVTDAGGPDGHRLDVDIQIVDSADTVLAGIRGLVVTEVR